MDRKVERLNLRLTEDEMSKVQQIATVTGHTLSEAVRHMLRNARLEPTTTVKVPTNSNADGLVLADPIGITH